MAKAKKKSSRRFVPRALFRTVCVTTVVPLCAIAACSTAGSGSIDAGRTDGYPAGSGGVMGVAAGGFMGVGAAAYGGMSGSGGMMAVAAGGFGGIGGTGSGGYMGVAAGAFGGQMNDASPDAPSDAPNDATEAGDASDGSAMLDAPADDHFGELGPSVAPGPGRLKRKSRA